MGTCYHLYNHENKTYYELGKGPWAHLLDSLNSFADFHEEVSYHFGDDEDDYLKLLYVSLLKFINKANMQKLHISGDDCVGDYDIAKSLGYVCNGSRYGLSDPEYNLMCIKDENITGAYSDCLPNIDASLWNMN
jgi:hypothetical protein